MVYIGGAIPASFRQRRSSKGRKGYLTEEPYRYPGMPRIGAVQQFRISAQRQLKHGERRLKRDIRTMELSWAKNQPVKKTQKNLIAPTRKRESMMEFNAYFDTSAYKAANEHIGDMVRQWGNKFLIEAMDTATEQTRSKIKGEVREFKGSYYSSEPHPRDVYNAVADSLKYVVRDQNETKNQFISINAGSFDEGDHDTPTGLKGSRGGNIGIMTEEGTSPTVMRGVPLGGTARIQNRLKTR